MKAGVLIIGSLLWQDDLKIGKHDELRKKWRRKHLLIDDKVLVKTSIRYGRFSKKDDIFTMVFSTECINRKSGTAFIVPLSTYCDNFQLIETEANALAHAEGMKGKFIGKTSDGEIWSVLSYLTNPALPKELQILLFDGWKTRLQLEGGYNPSDFRLGTEKPCLDNNGKLKIRWPVPVDPKLKEVVDSYDFLVATATKPTVYPSIKNHVTKILTDNKREYFLNNYNAGITTYQDAAIIKKLPKELF